MKATHALRALLLISLLLVACGDPTEEMVGDNQNNATTQELAWDLVHRSWGWLQIQDDGESVWIEREVAEIPDSCGGDLTAQRDSPGLAGVSWVLDVDTSSPNNIDPNSAAPETPSPPDLPLLPRPDLTTPPTTIYKVSVDGRIRDTQEGSAFARELEAKSTTATAPLCQTVYERGHCYIPDSEPDRNYNCISTPKVLPNTLRISTLSQEGSLLHITAPTNNVCGHGTPEYDPNHPQDLEQGTQKLSINMESLPEGEVTNLTPEQFTWASSYLTQRDCEDVDNPGLICDCTWSYKETLETKRAWALKQGQTLYLEIKGASQDEEFHIWGSFEL